MPAHRISLARAERFVWLSARVLDQRRFAYHFLDGPPDAVEDALAAYRNPDHGYGHALDPRLRGPASQPLHAAAALRVLDEIGRCHGHRTERLCRYLTAVSTPEGALPAVHPSQHGYPVAPWLPVPDPGASPPSDLLATGPVVGLLHRGNVWDAWMFRATDYCWAAVEDLRTEDPARLAAALAFLDGARDRPRAEAAADRLGRTVRRLLSGPAGGPVLPCVLAPTPRSLARRWFTDGDLERCLADLASRQQDDGGWPPATPRWPGGSEAARRAEATIDALRTLRAYGYPLSRRSR